MKENLTLIDYAAARAVALVIQTGSFERAARALNVTPSAVSQRVRALEERLGVVLIDRGTPCTATERGALLCRHMEHLGVLERDLLAHLPGLGDPALGPRVTLSVATNADSLGTWFLPAVARFAAAEDYLMNIAVDDEEHTAGWLRSGRVLAAVTALAHPVQGCTVRSLGRLVYRATASPAFIARHFADGVNPAALARAPALTFSQKDRLQQQWARLHLHTDIAFPTHWLPSTHGFVTACMEGMGWGLHPVPLIAAPLAEGRLAELVPDAVLEVPLYWQVNRLAAERLAPLTQAVLAAARQALV